MKQMDHNEYPKQLKKKTEDELRYIATDAAQARDANPMGENSGYYADEVHYAAAELQRRHEDISDIMNDALGG